MPKKSTQKMMEVPRFLYHGTSMDIISRFEMEQDMGEKPILQYSEINIHGDRPIPVHRETQKQKGVYLTPSLESAIGYAKWASMAQQGDLKYVEESDIDYDLREDVGVIKVDTGLAHTCGIEFIPDPHSDEPNSWMTNAQDIPIEWKCGITLMYPKDLEEKIGKEKWDALFQK